MMYLGRYIPKTTQKPKETNTQKRNINKLNAAYNVTRYLISMAKDKLILELEVLLCTLKEKSANEEMK